MSITVEPGTTGPARWGETVAIKPAVSPVPVVGGGFAPTPGSVELLAGAAPTGLTVVSWSATVIEAKLPGSAPGNPPYEIRVQDGGPVPHVAPINIDPAGFVIGTLGPIVLPPQPVPIPVPTMMVLFRLPDFDDWDDPHNGACTVVPLPGNPTEVLAGYDDNPDGLSQALNGVLGPVGEAINPGTSEPAYWANFFTGYERITRQVPLQKSIRTYLAPIANLKDIRYFTQKLAGLIDDWKADIYAEDTTSSLVLIGPTGTKATLFDYRNYNNDGGVLEIEITDETGAGAAVIPNLHRGDPVSETGGCRISARGASTWGDMIGSVTLDAPRMAFDVAGRTVMPLAA